MAPKNERVYVDVASMDEGLAIIEQADLEAKAERERHGAAVKAIAGKQDEGQKALIAATPEDAKLEAWDIGEDIDRRAYDLRQQLKALDDEKARRLAVVAAAYTPEGATDTQAARVFKAIEAVALVAIKALRVERAKAARATR